MIENVVSVGNGVFVGSCGDLVIIGVILVVDV